MSAAIILERLGGTRFQSLSRARDFSYPVNGIAFRLVQSGVKRVEITGNGDRYTMVFFNDMAEIARADVDTNFNRLLSAIPAFRLRDRVALVVVKRHRLAPQRLHMLEHLAGVA